MKASKRWLVIALAACAGVLSANAGVNFAYAEKSFSLLPPEDDFIWKEGEFPLLPLEDDFVWAEKEFWLMPDEQDVAQEALESIFDSANTPTIVERVYDAGGNIAGYKVILGQDYGPLAFSNDFGAVTIDLNGWKIAGADGTDGSGTTPGGVGSAAITVAGECGASAGATAVKLTDESDIQLWENGPYWARCNVGATKPEEAGYYFWWGDTVGYAWTGSQWDAVDGTKTGYSFSTCPTSNKTREGLESGGWIDGSGNLAGGHDAATAHLDSPWRLPTSEEMACLADASKCRTTWKNQNGVYGRLIQGVGAYASRSIFLPVGGRGYNAGLINSDEGYYMTSTPSSTHNDEECYLYFTSGKCQHSLGDYGAMREFGLTVRPLRVNPAGTRPQSGSGTNIVVVGGNGGDGNPAGKGSPAIAYADGTAVEVTDPLGLIVNGADGEFLKSPVQVELESIFDTANTPTVVEPAYTNGWLAGHLVTLGKGYGSMAFSNDFGVVKLDLNGWSIAGVNGVDGTFESPTGTDGGSAIVVEGTCGAAAGETVVSVTNTVPTACGIVGGKGGDGNPAGLGAFAIVTADGGEYAHVTDPLSLVRKGEDGLCVFCTVSFDAIGGTWADGTEVSNISFYVADGYVLPTPAPTRPGYIFAGWYESWTNGARKAEAGDEVFCDGDHSLYAKWVSPSLPAESDDAVLTYDVIAEGAVLTGAVAGKTLAKTDFAIPEFTSNDADADGAPYVSVGGYAFAYQNYDKTRDPAQRLTSVTFPTFVTNVGSHAFQDCRGLTNVTFAKTRDYATGEVAPIVVRDWAFKNSSVKTVVFPAGSQVILEEGAFGYAEKLREVRFLGDVSVAGTYPFIAAGRRNSAAGGAPTPVNVRLSAKLAADPAFVFALTNGMASVRLTLDQSVIGEIAPKTFGVSGQTVTLTFKVPADSPWRTVTPETLYGFYATTPEHVVVGTGTVLHPETLSEPDADGVYTATFTLPAEAESGFFRFCIGD